MRLMAALLAGAAFLLLNWGAVSGGEKKEPGNAEKILGTWEATKGDLPAGAVIEFTKDGKLKLRIKAEEKQFGMDGTYKVEGNRLTITNKSGGKERTDILTIKTLTDTTLALQDPKGAVEEFKRTK